MTDRELLEKAAKAAGRRFIEWTSDVDGVDVAIIVRADGDGFSKSVWQPLLLNQMTDCMGDALRLAVKLRMQIRVEDYGCGARIGDGAWSMCEAHLYGGIEAATRRAIVRAAAALAP